MRLGDMENLASQISTTIWAIRLSLVTFLILGIPLSVSGQDPVVDLSGEPSSNCWITITPVVTLGDSDGPGMIGGILAITKLADGRYALCSEGEDDLIKIFAADGRFLQSVGGRGEGPGEFSAIRSLETLGDVLHVFNIMPPRQTLFSPNFDVLRITRYQFISIYDLAVLSDSLTVFNAKLRNPDRIDYLLHAIDEKGNTKQSIAEIPGGYSADVSESRLYNRNLAPTSSGGVWIFHRTRYQLEEWSIDGNLLRTFVRHASWFPDNPESGGAMRDAQRRRLPRNLWPTGSDVYEDDAGRLLVAVRVPDMDWPNAVTVSRSIEGEYTGEYTEILDSQRARDTVIEVIDLQTGTLLASTQLDQSLYRFIGDNEIVSSSDYQEDGSTRVRIWKLELHYPPLEY